MSCTLAARPTMARAKTTRTPWTTESRVGRITSLTIARRRPREEYDLAVVGVAEPETSLCLRAEAAEARLGHDVALELGALRLERGAPSAQVLQAARAREPLRTAPDDASGNR